MQLNWAAKDEWEMKTGSINIYRMSVRLNIFLFIFQFCPDVIGIQIPNGKSLLHVCVEAGQVSVMEAILNYVYPPKLMKEFDTEDCTYTLPLDINCIDMEGQTALHLACERGEADVVRFLVEFSVKPHWKPKTRARKPVRKPAFSPNSSQNERYNPVKVNVVNNAGLIPLHIAIRENYRQVTEILLKANADVTAVVRSEDHDAYPLMMACKMADSFIMDKLLQYNATDFDRKVFNYAKVHQAKLLPILLKYRTIKDHEYPINKAGMKREYLDKLSGDSEHDTISSINLNYKRTFPLFPVHIKWQDLEHVSSIEDDDLKVIGYHHNPQMQTINSRFALYAITKVDVSGNNIGIVFPENLFRLPSLHYLDVSRNRISTFSADISTDCDMLQELRLDHNGIENLPSCMFKFDKLKVLSLAHNFLKEMSPEVWSMPSLIVLNLAENKLAFLQPPNLGKRSFRPRKHTPLKAMPSVDVGDYLQESEVQHATVWSTQLIVMETESDLINSADRQNSGLQDLNLSNNELQDVPSWLACVAPNLENLNVAHNWIRTVGMISNYPQHLKTLDLSSNRITDTLQFQYVDTEVSECL